MTVINFKQPQRKKERSFVGLLFSAMAVSFVGAAGGYWLMGNSNAVANAAAVVTKPLTAYGVCSGSVRYHCVVDGDTLWSGGIKIRIADIDTPEVSEPRCSSELALGNKATARLVGLVNEGSFEMRAWPGRDEDKSGRKLRVLVRDSRSLGDILVSEGLARTWTGRRQPWC
ncbi:thermonuclease family protein [Rhizobium ruizarguesonis]|uniref:thermonuclease family protein n=1 Tax=Rhizobium ruizarguesonis TaxID=2081791 RepID=UPI00102F76FA|nr:thermonuclease family protein [Rhizobium ruizarguesonis]TAU25108.1 thermonuclease family protein [Rhizobium ruizarguesonis]TAW08504.1 thermonuclease family protein [Rhizobium ruizarguesonis]